MDIVNIEIKVKCNDPDRVENILKSQNAEYIGTDYQLDTYYKTKLGRLKLRKGNIENSLIFYDRDNEKGPKKSEVILQKLLPDNNLKEILDKSLDILTSIDKKRKIYYIENVKFHIDTVDSLGSFIEIEAIDKDGNIGQERLLEQCEKYIELFGLDDIDFVSESYSDLRLYNENKKEKITGANKT